MMASTAGLVPVAKTRVIDYGADTPMTQQRLAFDVTNYTRNQIILLLRSTAAEETAKQIRIDNPPDVVISDNVRGKKASEAVKRIEVGFGQRIKPAALEALKKILATAIKKSTARRSGTLANVASNWSYVYLKNGKATPLPIGNRAGIPLSQADAIILRPTGVPHATVANIASSRARTRSRNKERAAKGITSKAKRVAPGFIASATAAARRSPIFAGFNVAARWTDNTVAGEKFAKKLSITIMITLKTGKRGRRR